MLLATDRLDCPLFERLGLAALLAIGIDLAELSRRDGYPDNLGTKIQFR